MTTIRKNMIRSALLLSLFALVGTGLLSLTYEATHERIAQNERDELIRNLHKIISPDKHDNDIFHDTIEIQHPYLLGTEKPVTVYRARKNGVPVTAVFSSIAPNGYNGTIKLLIGIDTKGQLTGVRVIAHRETPGLGDAIEAERSDWILGFKGKSLLKPAEKDWKVKKDGGFFDQFTGATITPRAIVKAVKNTLLYYKLNKHLIYSTKQQGSGNTHE